MIFIFTGNGKGKTTSAIGQAIRVLGQDGRVAMFQFIKSKQWPTGEEKTIKQIKKFKLIKGGKGFVGILGDKLPRKIHEIAAKKTLKMAQEAILSRKFKLIILDEANVALSLKLISKKEVINILKSISKEIDLIFTGRDAPAWLLERADIATEFKEIKHPFQKGIIGKKSREY